MIAFRLLGKYLPRCPDIWYLEMTNICAGAGKLWGKCWKCPQIFYDIYEKTRLRLIIQAGGCLFPHCPSSQQPSEMWISLICLDMVCMAIFRARKFQNLSKAMASRATFPHYRRIENNLLTRGRPHISTTDSPVAVLAADTLMAVFAP